MEQLRKLFEPITVGQLKLKNRTVMAPMNTCLGDVGVSMQRAQWVAESTKRWYEERARGGVGMIITGSMYTNPYYLDDEPPYFPGMYAARFALALQEMVELIHSIGTPIAMQLHTHVFPPSRPGGKPRLVAAGREIRSRSAIDVVGASDLPIGKAKPRPLSTDEIQEIVQFYGKSARRGRALGFDAICLNFGIGGIENQFISPLSNNRTDEYGGSLENRMRFPLEIIKSIKKEAGSDWTITVRVGASDFMDGGLTIEDTKQYTPMLEKAGVAAISVIGGWHIAPVPIFQSSVPRGVLVEMAREIKDAVSIPVMVSHRINDPLLAEQILVEGKADLIELGRALVADSEFVRKAKEGEFDNIRKCIACSRCLDNVMRGTPIRCTVNPRAGRENEYRIEPASKPKKLIVIGGGVAGLEAARVAALRGHKVALIEKQTSLGGQLLIAAQLPHKDEIKQLVHDLTAQVRKSGVKIRLNEEATVESIVKQKPDAVVVATGAQPVSLSIPGVRKNHVMSATDVLRQTADTGENVIVIGGGSLGCEIAEFLASKGKEVTIVEMLTRIGQDITPAYRWVVLQRLRKMNVRTETETTVEEITDSGVKAKKK